MVVLNGLIRDPSQIVPQLPHCAARSIKTQAGMCATDGARHWKVRVSWRLPMCISVYSSVSSNTWLARCVRTKEGERCWLLVCRSALGVGARRGTSWWRPKASNQSLGRGSRQGVRTGLHPFDCLASISSGAPLATKNRTGSGVGQAARAAGGLAPKRRRQPTTSNSTTNYHRQLPTAATEALLVRAVFTDKASGK